MTAVCDEEEWEAWLADHGLPGWGCELAEEVDRAHALLQAEVDRLRAEVAELRHHRDGLLIGIDLTDHGPSSRTETAERLGWPVCDSTFDRMDRLRHISGAINMTAEEWQAYRDLDDEAKVAWRLDRFRERIERLA